MKNSGIKNSGSGFGRCAVAGFNAARETNSSTARMHFIDRGINPSVLCDIPQSCHNSYLAFRVCKLIAIPGLLLSSFIPSLLYRQVAIRELVLPKYGQHRYSFVGGHSLPSTTYGCRVSRRQPVLVGQKPKGGNSESEKGGLQPEDCPYLGSASAARQCPVSGTRILSTT